MNWTAWFVTAALAAGTTSASELDTLVEWMTGSFSSAAQAEADESYFDIRLEMTPIWTDRTDAAWLYVEQAAASALDKPYRQRVYRVTEEDGTFVSEVFSLSEPLRFAGAFADPARFAELSPDSLQERTGCAVHLERGEDGRFHGSTRGEDCLSSLRGGRYATAAVTVGPDGMESWDRGFDAEGEQVWGATAGAYRFDRVENAAE